MQLAQWANAFTQIVKWVICKCWVRIGYLSLITVAYSKLIVGYCLHPFLTAEGSLKALDMALSTHLEREDELIHYSAGCPVRSWQPIL